MQGFAAPPPGFKVFHGMGCDQCEGSGYLGRVAIFEILEVTEAIRALVTEGAATDGIQAAAREGGMRTLYEAGLAAVKAGVTTPEEIARVIAKIER